MGTEQQLGIGHIYVVHALRGYEEHEKRLHQILGNQLGMEYELVTDGDPSLWTDELVYRYFVPNIREVLSNGVLSCTLNHILCCEKMLENGDDVALIFENDPFLLHRFTERLAAIVAELKREQHCGVIVSLENTTLTFPPRKSIRKNKLLYPARQGRCAGAYLLDQAAAQQIVNDLRTHKCATVVDWWHNDMVARGVVGMLWAHPPIVEQGSHNGKLHATISTKSRGW
jgi:glycosyl transferase family 25